MATLSSSLVKHRVATMSDVEEALARQVLYGGDLITNLLELAAVSESELVTLLAQSYGLPPGPAGELPAASEATRRLVPGELALRHGFYPLAEHGGALVLAVSEPLSPEVLEDLEFALGARVEQQTATSVRIRQAIGRDYGLPLDRRTLRVIAKLEGLPDPMPSVIPERPASPTPSPPRSSALNAAMPRRTSSAKLSPGMWTDAKPEFSSVPPPAAAQASSAPGVNPIPAPPLPAVVPAAASRAPAGPASTASLAENSARVAPGGAPLGTAPLVESSAPRRGSAARPRRLGPYTAAMAEKDLMEAESSDAVLGAFFDFASQYFIYSALFAVKGDLAEGRLAAGPGAAGEQVSAIGIPLDLPSAAAKTRERQSWQLVRLAEDGIDGSLARDLKREPGPLVLLLPVSLRERTVLLLYGDHGSADVELSRVGDVIAFAPLVSQALERLLVKRKARAGTSVAPRAPAPASRAPERAAPSPEQRKAALVKALELPARRPSSRPPRTASTPALVLRPVIALGPEPVAPSPVSQAPAAPTRPPERLSVPADEEPPEDDWEVTPPNHGPEIEITASEAPAPPSSAPLDQHQLDASWTNSVREVPLAAPSRSEAFAPQRPRPRQSSQERQLPTVIVNLESDYRNVVERVIAGDEDAIRRVIEIGEPVVSLLVARFPGPTLTQPLRGLGEQPLRASDCGPLLKALALIGAPAAPFVIVRTADGDPRVRSWATRLLGELHTVESANAVGRRFVDTDPEVRRAATAAARMLQTHANLAAALRETLLNLVSDSAHAASRHAAIEAFAEIRDVGAVPDLILLLRDPLPDVVRSAQWALVTITRQDFGLDAARWSEWWQANAPRHRIEWLIDALMHDVPDIRRAAGEELKSLSKEYFGFYEDLPPAERARAQQRYREWWGTKGKARFR